MQLREWMNNNSAATTVGAVVLLLVALAILLNEFGLFGSGGATNMKSYYFDVKTGKVFTGDASDPYPPIAAPSGPNNGVLAYMFSCSDCSTSHFLGYLEKYTPAAKKKLESLKPNEDGTYWMVNGRVVRLAKPGSKWIQASSEAGNKLTQVQINAHCKPTDEVKRCYPN